MHVENIAVMGSRTDTLGGHQMPLHPLGSPVEPAPASGPAPPAGCHRVWLWPCPAPQPPSLAIFIGLSRLILHVPDAAAVAAPLGKRQRAAARSAEPARMVKKAPKRHQEDGPAAASPAEEQTGPSSVPADRVVRVYADGEFWDLTMPLRTGERSRSRDRHADGGRGMFWAPELPAQGEEPSCCFSLAVTRRYWHAGGPQGSLTSSTLGTRGRWSRRSSGALPVPAAALLPCASAPCPAVPSPAPHRLAMAHCKGETAMFTQDASRR